MIEVENVTLEFPTFKRNSNCGRRSGQNQLSVGGQLSSGGSGMHVRALDDVSFTLQRGDRLALLGHNGAGKTTLLRVLAGIYPTTKGRVFCNGRVVPLLNLTFGLDMEATGEENIWVRGLYLGMSKSEIKAKIESIAKFSDLGDFLYMPMRTYSSGMRSRLAFAVSTHVDGDILLLDEVVATGDATFVDKARQQLEDISSQSKILVLASHSNKVLRALCNKGLLLEHGRVKCFGELDDVIETYWRSITGATGPMPAVNTTAPHKTIKTVPPIREGVERVLLLNDTGTLPNPGCRAVRKGYKVLFGQHIKNSQIIASVPVSYWIEPYREMAVQAKKSFEVKSGKFPVSAKEVADIDITKWEQVRQTLSKSDQNISAWLKNCDKVLINGEGSIHHNTVRSLALMALAKTAIEAGKKVYLLNSTIQAMSPRLMREVLPQLTFVHVREKATQAYLESLGVRSFMAPDLAFLAMDELSHPLTKLLDASDYVLVTGGVTVNEESLGAIFKALQAALLKPVYLSIGDGGEREIAARVCRERNIPVVEAGEIGVKEMIGFLRQFPMAISGRHHINIYLMRAGVPFVPLCSNTWKIEETLRLAGYPIEPVVDYRDLLPSLNKIKADRETFALASKKAFIAGKEKMRPLIDELKLCL